MFIPIVSYDIVTYRKYIYLVIQMTEIYFSGIFGLHPQFLAHHSQTPWNFLSDERNMVSHYVNEMTFWSPPKDGG